MVTCQPIILVTGGQCAVARGIAGRTSLQAACRIRCRVSPDSVIFRRPGLFVCLGCQRRLYAFGNLVNPHPTRSRVLPTARISSCHAVFRTADCLSTIRHWTQKSCRHYAASSAFRLSDVDKVQVVLLVHWGTFASMPNPTFAGKDFKISRMKYRAPIL